MQNIPQFAKTMIGTGIGTILAGGGVWAAQTFGAPPLAVTALGISSLTLPTLGAIFSINQFYKYIRREHAHHD